jgi:hypothetical protein
LYPESTTSLTSIIFPENESPSLSEPILYVALLILECSLTAKFPLQVIFSGAESTPSQFPLLATISKSSL